jgi:sugar O-acyltransferase (sialic acid O-acetyltransferase NeuD family)
VAEILLFGGNSESIKLCENQGHSILAVVDPDKQKEFRNQLLIDSDPEALLKFPGAPVVVAIDECFARERVFDFLQQNSAVCVPIVGGITHSSPGNGIFMQINSFISSDVIIGSGVRLNYGATAMHDCRLGDFVTLAPNAMLLGGVTVGDCSYVGACATVLPGVTIGSECMIGAGAVVIGDVPDGTTVVGVPAKPHF